MKMILTALAASVSLSGCGMGYERHHRPSAYDERGSYLSDSEVLKSDIFKVQRALNRKGFYKGRVDGVWGWRTSQAILHYQAAHSQKGVVTVETVHELADRIGE